MRKALGVLFLLGMAACGAAQVTAKAADTVYTVDAIRYGTMPSVAVSNLVSGLKNGRKIDTAMIYWLVRGGGRTVLVDTGFYRPKFFKQWPVRVCLLHR